MNRRDFNISTGNTKKALPPTRCVSDKDLGGYSGSFDPFKLPCRWIGNFTAIPMAIERTKECSVCFLEDQPLILPCDHTVCVECTKRIATQTCPMCRAPFMLTQLKRM